MPFIGVAIAAAVGLPAIAGTLINIGLAVGLSFVSRALTGAASATSNTGIQTTIKLGGDVPRGLHSRGEYSDDERDRYRMIKF